MLKTAGLTLIFFVFSCYYTNAQIILNGIISNEKGMSLPDANILAIPQSGKGKLSFTTSEEDGSYNINLISNLPYKITISYLGYINQEVYIDIKNDNLNRDFTLMEDINELKEVVINYNEPITIKKDTTVYDVSAFINGKERKLREVLKKLPGVEVDRKGNVTVQGKRVTKVLVEDKTFFTGDSKLAINNIPADVLDEIEVIDDFHETPFMKGLEESSDLAMNIKLKEDKKRFLFGDLEAGGGIEERYLAHPALFYYSPKTTYNFIGDYNNSGEKSFSFKDYVNFEGSFDKNTFSSLYNSSIAALLREQDITDSKHKFGGFNFQFTPNTKNELNTFIIGLSNDNKTRTKHLNNYIIDDVIEQRTSSGKQDQSMILGKLKYRYIPTSKTYINFDTKIEASTLEYNLFNDLNLVNEAYQFNTNNDLNEFNLQSNLKIEKQFSKAHTSTLSANHNLFDKKNLTDWNSTANIFSEVLPIVDDTTYNVLKDLNNLTSEFNFLFKHYWVINRKNHIYTSVGYQFLWDELNINNFQLLTNQEQNSFPDFVSNLKNNKNMSFLNIEYKRLLGSAFMTLKLSYEYYYRIANQLGRQDTRTKIILRPEFNFKYDIDNKTEFNLSYRLSTYFPNTRQFNLANSLNSFNNIYTGNINLIESYYHSFRLSYRRFRTYNLSIYPSIGYRYREKTVNNVYQTDGIYSFFTPVNIKTPSEELSGNLRFVYNKPYWKAAFTSNFSTYNYATFVEDNEVLNSTNSISNDLSFSTKFEENPNIDLSFRQTFNTNKTGHFKSPAIQSRLNLTVDYQWKDFMFNGGYSYSFYKNHFSNSINKFNEINASIFYQKEDSPWGFEILGNNLGNNSNKISTTVSSILFNEIRTFVFPRTIIFKLSYKL